MSNSVTHFQAHSKHWINGNVSFIIIITSISIIAIICYCNKWPQTWQLKTVQMYSYSCRGQKSKMCLTGLKWRCWLDCVSSESSRGESVSLPFPAARGHPHSLARGLSTLKASNASLHPSDIAQDDSASLFPLWGHLCLHWAPGLISPSQGHKISKLNAPLPVT